MALVLDDSDEALGTPDHPEAWLAWLRLSNVLALAQVPVDITTAIRRAMDESVQEVSASRIIAANHFSVYASRADLVLAVSPDLAERARDLGAPRVELAVIPAAAPQPRSEPASPAPAALEDVWPQDSARVLTVARLAPQKGLPLLLDAAAILARDVEAGHLPAFTWAVAGDGPGKAEAAERIAAERLPVSLLGRRTDATGLMEDADVVVQTSLWEGQPLTIQEALRAGVAIVATDVGGTAVTARGGAVLVAPEAHAIAEALAAILTDPRARTRAAQSARQASGLLPGSEDLSAQLRQAVLAQH